MPQEEKQLVIPKDLVPSAWKEKLEPPKLPTAEEFFGELLDRAKAGELALRCAATLKIDGPEAYKDALDMVKELKGNANRLEEFRKSKTDPATAYAKNLKAITDLPIELYLKAAKHVGDLATDWFLAEQKRIAEEKARLERELEEERKKTAALEAEKRAAEEKRQAQEAEELRRTNEQATAAATAAGDEFTQELQGQAAMEERHAQVEQERAERQEAAQAEIDQAQINLADKERKTFATMSTLKHTAPGGVRMVWTYEIVDATKVHRRYCDPTASKLKAAVDSGLRMVDPQTGEPDPLAAGLKIYQKPEMSGRGGGAR